MERYLLQFMLVTVTFSGGGLLLNAWLNELSSKNIEIEAPPNIEAEAVKLTFECSRDEIRNVVTWRGAFGGTCIGSDGSELFVGSYSDTWTKDAANRTFEKELKGALKVVSITSIFDNQATEIGKRALIKNKGKVKIIELLKVDEKQFYRPYVVSLIEASNFKHALAFENQQKEASRSIRAASF